jgi:hypothetical protein
MDVIGGIVICATFGTIAVGFAIWGLLQGGAMAGTAVIIGVPVAGLFAFMCVWHSRTLRWEGLLLTEGGFELGHLDIAWSDIERFELVDGEAGVAHIKVVCKQPVTIAIRQIVCEEEPLIDVLNQWWSRYRPQ